MGTDVGVFKENARNIRIDFFDKKWFDGKTGYQLLKQSKQLYQRYADYEFMLTYELDAYVFRDELEYWCNKQYDYIGAPWFEGYMDANSNSQITGVGNSGFSLRKIDACLEALEMISQKPLDAITTFYKNRWHQAVPSIFRASKYGWASTLFGYPRHEDVFWCDLVPQLVPNLNIATVEDAQRFAFEVNPELLYLNTGNTLPFGCHAWRKCSPGFWKEQIPGLTSVSTYHHWDGTK